jgi:cobalt-zinc-cadmium resistance protein CzcA
MAYAGQGAGWVYEGEKRFELVVRMEDAVRQNPDAMSNLMIPVKSGQSIPLSVLANIKIQEGPNQIQREDARRRIVTGFNIRGVDVQTVVSEIQNKVEKEITLPPGYRIQYGGSFENLEKAKSRLLLAVPAALLMILLLLYFAFYSVRQAILIFTAVPLSAIGGILGLYFRDMPFSISAGVGFIALFGVAVLNGIVLMAEFNRRKKLPGSKLSSVVLGGSKTRLRPVLMTAMVASLGFLPMALSTGAGAEVQKPLATVVIGGLLLATFLTLFLLPILFAWSERGYFTRKLLPLVFIPMIFIPQIVSAQTVISYNEALILAKSTNQELSNAQSDIEYSHALIKSGSTIPRLDIQAEYGQLNSIYSDRRVSIAQTFDYPGVYTQQKNILENEHRQMQTIKIGKEADLIRELKWVFMEYFFLTQRRDLLSTTDSIIRNSLKLAALRLKLGETDALELTAIQTQQSIVLNQLQDLENQEVSIRLKLSLLLNSAEKFVPAVEDVSGVTVPAALLSIENHPSIQLQELNSRLSLTQISLERMRRMPEFSIGFAGMSMYGMGANEMFYNYSRVFQSIQLGIAIPIWGNVHSSKIAAAKINRETTIRRMNFERQKIQWEYESLLARRQLLLKQQEQLEKMQNSSLKQESDILSLRMQKGDLSILEWNYLIQQQLSIRLEYWRVKEQLAQVTILISSYNFN